MPKRRSAWRYLCDADVLHALAVALVALIGSAGLVYVGYLVHVWHTAAVAPRLAGSRRVVLVFGRKLVNDAPEADFRHRLNRCLLLMQADLAERVLLLGGMSGGHLSEAAAGATWLQAQGSVPDVALVLEQASTDSLENLRQARELLRAGHASASDAASLTVTLITSRYHLARCLMLARRLGFDAHPVGAEERIPRSTDYVGLMIIEAAYLMWIDLGVRWAQLIGHRRMATRIA